MFPFRTGIEIRNLNVKYGDYLALKNINLRINHPSFVVIIGPNGAGKTTLLKALLDLIPYEGEVRIFGKKPREIRERMGYLPQRENININIPLLVKDVVLMPISSRRFILRREDVERAKKYLKLVGMLDYWNHRFDALSGGQQQRVLFARTLMNDPDIIVLDEPFSATDVATKMNLIRLLHKISKEKTVILVTHDINPLAECTDMVVLLRRKVISYGNVMDTITEENMEKLYGVRVPVIRIENICYVAGSDVHV